MRAHAGSRLARLAGVVLLLAALAPAAAPAGAQEPQPEAQAAAAPAPSPSEEVDPSAPMGPDDPLNRGTPRGSVYGFIVSANAGEWKRAAEFLDLRRLPADERAARGPDLALKLKFILDQTIWVDWDRLSPSAGGQTDDGLPAYQDRLGRIDTAKGPVDVLLQRVPRESDGVRIWKFAAQTVDHIPALMEDYGVGPFMKWLPRWFFAIQASGLTLFQWTALLLLVGLAWVASALLSTLVIHTLHAVYSRGRRLDRRIVRVVQGPVRLGLLIALFEVGHRTLRLSVRAIEVIGGVQSVLLIVAVVWLAMRAVDLGSLFLRQRMLRSGQEGMVPVLVPGQRIVKGLLIGLGVLAVLSTLGVNVTAALAGLGVGGIAVALAAQKTIENLFGGATLYADQPIRVGDFCRFGDRVGTVEEIGLRSTRIRTLDRTVVSIPNAEFSQLHIENFARRDQIWLNATLGVRYETTPEQLRYLLARLREMLLAHPKVSNDPARVRFVGFGAYSLDLEVFAYTRTSDWNEFLEIREDVYLRIMDIVAETGTGFAFPSSTTYVGRDDGLDEERGRQAADHVARWRKEGRLPFPRTPEERLREVVDTLDWPPEGSAGHPLPPRPPTQGADTE